MLKDEISLAEVSIRSVCTRQSVGDGAGLQKVRV